jgi:hypothetical protein
MPTWTGNGSTNNWSEAANWNTGVVPAAGTDAIFDGVASPNGNKNCTITSGAICKDWILTGYSGTIAVDNGIVIRGNVTLDLLNNFTGVSGMVFNAFNIVHTLTSNGKVWGRNIVTNVNGLGTGSINFADNWTIATLTTIHFGFANPINMGGPGVLSVSGNLSLGQILVNSNTIKIIGNSTVECTSSGRLTNLEFDAGSNTITINGITISSGFLRYTSGNLTGPRVVSLLSTSTISLDMQGQPMGQLQIGFNDTITLLSDYNASTNLVVGGAAGSGVTINGAFTIFIDGNLTLQQIGAIQGTATIEITGTSNISSNGTPLNLNLTFNSGVDTITLVSNLPFGSTGTKTLKHLSGDFNPNGFKVTLYTGVVVEAGGISFYDVDIRPSAIIDLQEVLNVSNIINCLGSATFIGTHGFTVGAFSAQVAASILTFQNINANPLAEYRITNNLTIIGTALSRITLQSAGGALFTGTANGTSLTYASGTIPTTGMTISQRTGQAPPGLLSLFPNRPVITGVVVPGISFTLDLTVTPTTGSILMRAGYKAVFILENNGVATQNVAYTTCQDIDSGLGQPILSFASNNDDQTTNVSLFRTINWGSLDPPPVQGRNYASVYVY